MAQILPPSANLAVRLALVGILPAAAGLLWLLGAMAGSSWVTRAGSAPAQPVPFSHKLHVGGLGLDCRHCHTLVETGAGAGMPSTKTCMHCHAQIFSDAALLEPVRAAMAEDRSIEWLRVADLPDFVYFDHSIHVRKGFACVTCHGRVDQMPVVEQPVALTMRWCLDCHRNPERYVRPPEQVFSMSWEPEGDPAAVGARLARELGLRRPTDCSFCHR
jgi:hypothetical protein